MATVLSVNIGRPRAVPCAGRRIRTAIFKEPAPGRVRVGRTNLEGDRHADLRIHGGPDKAVYAYDLSAHAHWCRELSRDLPYGRLGENLSVEGLPETEVRIGDAYRVGTALLQVSKPRSPCLKLALRLQRPEFPRLFLESGRTGSTSAFWRRATSGRATRSSWSTAIPPLSRSWRPRGGDTARPPGHSEAKNW